MRSALVLPALLVSGGRAAWKQRCCQPKVLTTAATRCVGSLVFSPTRIGQKDQRRGDRGESRRLTFDERAERRMGKSREQKIVRENLLQEAEKVIQEDVPDELEQIFMQHFERANVSAMKVLNMAKCLELLEADVGGGRKVLLTKVAQVVKTNNTTIEIVPQNASFASPILQRVTRFDGTLQVTKEQQKIKVVMPPVTTARRDKAVQEINQVISLFKQKTKHVRTNASKALQDASIEENALRELNAQLDTTVNAFTEEKVAELEQLAADVTSMGVDESDFGA
ncbi:ribosome recycling factor [Trypanosoma cruzi]|nr:ribosome recycling factor [Trypanosoma cruzi]